MKKKTKKFTIPDIEPFSYLPDEDGLFSKELLAIEDPAMQLAIIQKKEAESCGDRYSGMTDSMWYQTAKGIVQLVQK